MGAAPCRSGAAAQKARPSSYGAKVPSASIHHVWTLRSMGHSATAQAMTRSKNELVLVDGSGDSLEDF